MNERIKVLYFTNTTVRAGVEEHLLTLLRHLDRARFVAALVCPPQLFHAYDGDIPRDVCTTPLLFDSFARIGAAAKLARIIRQWQPDIIHTHMFSSSLFCAPVAWLAGNAAVIETTHVRESWRRGWIKSRFFVDRFISNFIDRYIAVSEANRTYLIRDKGIAAAKVETVANGCDLHRFMAVSGSRTELRERLGIAADQQILMVGARLEPQKGHSILLRAMPTIRKRFPRVHLLCVGDGSLRSQLQDQARGLGLEDCVTFVGFRADMENWLALADVVVLPSYYEGLPLIAIEALAAGRPMVATSVDGTSEVLIHEKTGLTVMPGDVQELSTAICRLLSNPSWAETLAESGRKWVAAHYTQEEQLRKTEALYINVLGLRRHQENLTTPQVQPLSSSHV